MNAMLERWIVFGMVVLSFLCAWRASAKTPITVHKVFHHTAADTSSLELGSLVLYGTGLPKDHLKPHIVVLDDKEEYRFVIPRVTISDTEIRNKLQSLKNHQDIHGYQVTVEDLKKPESGLAITFRFPKDQCEVACTYTNSIQHEKGIAFHIYNRTLIQSLKKQQSPVIRTALHTPPRIFIDPGHGGDDTGAVAQSGVMEKDVCLAVSKKVQTQLCELGYKVCMSRDTDVPIQLDMRTHTASHFDADLVVSIHANAAPSPQAVGTEIFFLDPHCAECRRDLSSDMYAVLKRYTAVLTECNHMLATNIHDSLKKSLPMHNTAFKDRGIKTAISQVLLGAARPAVLIEIGFLTHPTEALLLANTAYQSAIAHAIAQGIRFYCVNMLV